MKTLREYIDQLEETAAESDVDRVIQLSREIR